MKKYGKKGVSWVKRGAEGGVRGRRARPWQRHVQGHRCRRILQCVTRLEFGVRLFGVSVRLFLFFKYIFFLILHWLAFCLFHFFFLWVVPPENVNLPQKMCTYKHTLLWCAVPIYYPYAPCMRIFSSVHTYHGVLVLGRVCANWPRVSG